MQISLKWAGRAECIQYTIQNQRAVYAWSWRVMRIFSNNSWTIRELFELFTALWGVLNIQNTTALVRILDFPYCEYIRLSVLDFGRVFPYLDADELYFGIFCSWTVFSQIPWDRVELPGSLGVWSVAFRRWFQDTCPPPGKPGFAGD